MSVKDAVISDDETSRLFSQGIDGSPGSKGDNGDPGKSVSLFYIYVKQVLVNDNNSSFNSVLWSLGPSRTLWRTRTSRKTWTQGECVFVINQLKNYMIQLCVYLWSFV